MGNESGSGRRSMVGQVKADPNWNLDAQLAIARLANGGSFSDLYTDLKTLSTLVVALDEWLSNGGSLPARWARAAAPVPKLEQR